MENPFSKENTELSQALDINPTEAPQRQIMRAYVETDCAPCRHCGGLPYFALQIFEDGTGGITLTCGSDNAECVRFAFSMDKTAYSKTPLKRLLKFGSKHSKRVWNEHQSGIDTAKKYGSQEP